MKAKQELEPKAGSEVVFGRYPQSSDDPEPIVWKVLEREGDSMLVISRLALDCKRYNDIDGAVTWKTCTLRKWLNNEFLGKAFTSEEQKLIQMTKVKAEENPEYDVSPGEDTEDKVFLLSIQEAERYFKTDKERECKPTPYAVYNDVYVNKENDNCWWWLRSTGRGPLHAAYVSDLGSIGFDGFWVDDCEDGVRPCLRLQI